MASGRTDSARSGAHAGALPSLHFIERGSDRILGALTLRHAGEWTGAAGPIELYEVTRATQHCLSWVRQHWNRWLQGRALRRRTTPSVIALTPEAVERISVFYLCPRPVVLVSVADNDDHNLFPMDLIGPLAGEEFTLALRTRSDSVAVLQRTRRAALADMPASTRESVQALGNLPRGVRVDWRELPFRHEPSKLFSLRTPTTALRVREVEIVDSRNVGSHCLFRSRVVSEIRNAHGAQLFHTSGMYQHLRIREGRAFARAG